MDNPVVVKHEIEMYDIFGGKEHLTTFMELQLSIIQKTVVLCNTSGIVCTNYVDCYKRISKN